MIDDDDYPEVDVDDYREDAQDDDDGEHPFSAEDYATAAENLAQEAAQAQDDATEVDAESEPGLLDGLDPRLAAYVQKLRRESADKRTAMAELDDQLKGAAAEIEAMQEWCLDRMRRDVEALAAGHRMLDPAELWHVAELHEMANDEHSDIDEAKVAEIIETRVPQHWRVQVKYDHRRTAAPSSGATGNPEDRPTSWAQALAPPQE
jgi:hypothetical protein